MAAWDPHSSELWIIEVDGAELIKFPVKSNSTVAAAAGCSPSRQAANERHLRLGARTRGLTFDDVCDLITVKVMSETRINYLQ